MYGIDLLVTSVSSVTKLPPGSLIYLISVGPFILYAACYVSYFFWQTVQNAILAYLGKPGPDEFWPFNLIQRARRKQKIEQKIELALDRASICDMLNSRTEIVSSTFERYGLILSSIRIHPYDDNEYACDLKVESREGTELTDDVYIHVLLFDDNDYETSRLDITIRAYGFSGYLVNNNEEFSISSDAVPTHMEVYVDKNR